MNPFVDPKKRSISLPGGVKDLSGLLPLLDGSTNSANVSSQAKRTLNSSARKYIELVLQQAQEDNAMEVVIGVASAD